MRNVGGHWQARSMSRTARLARAGLGRAWAGLGSGLGRAGPCVAPGLGRACAWPGRRPLGIMYLYWISWIYLNIFLI